jgi:hypothetical protein
MLTGDLLADPHLQLIIPISASDASASARELNPCPSRDFSRVICLSGSDKLDSISLASTTTLSAGKSGATVYCKLSVLDWATKRFGSTSQAPYYAVAAARSAGDLSLHPED